MFTKKVVLAAAVMIWMILLTPTARLARADGTHKKTPDPSKSAEGSTPGSTSGAAATSRANSLVENELQRLKEDLRVQRATLEAQQIRIAQLEAQSHDSTAEPPALALVTPSPVSEPVVGGTRQPNPLQSGATVEGQVKSPLSFKIGAADFTPGGWADVTGIIRSTDIGSGTGTNFTSIPFNNMLPQAALSEFRFTAQTSRISLKVNTPVGDSTSVTGYVESDFNGFQPPNAYINTNSSTFRLRLFWADVRHGNWEFLGGQSWSLLTPNRVGLSPFPADIFTSYRLDTNYLAGLTFARQAGFRVVYHPANWWALGASLENAQQYAPSSVVFPGAAGFFAGQFDNGSGATNAGSATTNTAIPNLRPDVVVKIAFDWKLGGRALHLESAGLIRSFKDFNNLVTPNATNAITGEAGAVNLNFELFNGFRLIANSLYGDGGGRYIGGLGPDVVVKPNGTLSPVHSGSGVGGFEWQITPRLLLDAYYSGAFFARNFGLLASTARPVPTCAGISGFTCVGFGFPGSANTNNRVIQEGSFGFTKTLWANPNYGRLQLITQSSYVVRSPWSVPPASPKNAHAFLEYVDLRYVLP